MSAALDDGWFLESDVRDESQIKDDDPLTKLVREALTLLDGTAPERIELEGDGWSLVDPQSVGRAPIATPAPVQPAPTQEAKVISLQSLMHDVLDAAMAEGWLADEDDRHAA